jgi:hypothetical protein
LNRGEWRFSIRVVVVVWVVVAWVEEGEGRVMCPWL